MYIKVGHHKLAFELSMFLVGAGLRVVGGPAGGALQLELAFGQASKQIDQGF